MQVARVFFVVGGIVREVDDVVPVGVERSQHLVLAEDTQTLFVDLLFGGRVFPFRRRGKVDDLVVVDVEICLRDCVEFGRQPVST